MTLSPGGGHLSKHVEAARPGHAHYCLSCVRTAGSSGARHGYDLATATSSPCPPHMVSLLPLAPILRRLSISALPASAASVRHASAYARFFLRAPRLMATKPVLIGATERRAPQLLHCSQASPVGGARRSARGAMGAMGVGRSRMGLVRHGMGLAMIRVKGEGEGEGVRSRVRVRVKGYGQG